MRGDPGPACDAARPLRRSAARAEASVSFCEKAEDEDAPGRVTVSEDPSDIPAVPMAVEAVVESEPVKRELLAELAGACRRTR